MSLVLKNIEYFARKLCNSSPSSAQIVSVKIITTTAALLVFLICSVDTSNLHQIIYFCFDLLS